MKKVFSLTILFVLFIQFVSLVLAQAGIPTVPMPREPQIYEPRPNAEVGGVLIIIALIISTAIGIISMIFMIKRSAKIPNLIIHGLIFLGSIIWLIMMIFNFTSQHITSGSVVDPDMIEIGWPLLFGLVISGYFFFGLIRKKDFAEKRKYTLGLSSGGIITLILGEISMITISIIYQFDGLGVGLLAILLFTVGIVTSVVLGLIGYFIDKKNN